MKKTITVLLAALFAVNTYAGAKGGFTNGDAGIVTPDMARGMRSFDVFHFDTNGDMVVCFYDDYSRGKCQNWKPVKNVVPAGTTYVGFRVVGREYGYRQLEVYWK